MTQISRDSTEVTTAAGPVYLDSTAGTVSTAGYDTERFYAAFGYFQVANASTLDLYTYIEHSQDNVTYYRPHEGATGDTQGNHNVLWTGMTGGSNIMMMTWPIGRYTRATAVRKSGSGDVTIRLGFKS